MPAPFLSVIIPAYNEAERLPKTLIDIDRRLSKAKYAYEIIVSDDGSKDATPQIVEEMRKTIKYLRLLRFEKNRGKGAVVRDGMLAAHGKYRVFMDADNSTTVDHFDKMLPYFEEGYSVVICSRAHKDSKLDPPEPWYRQLPGKLGNLFWIQLWVLPGLWDTQCGFKAFTTEAAERVFRHSRISGWGFDIEALALAKKYGFLIKEIPVHWVNDTHSKVSASAYLKVLVETFKIRWWLWMGKYNLSSDEEP